MLHVGAIANWEGWIHGNLGHGCCGVVLGACSSDKESQEGDEHCCCRVDFLRFGRGQDVQTVEHVKVRGVEVV